MHKYLKTSTHPNIRPSIYKARQKVQQLYVSVRHRKWRRHYYHKEQADADKTIFLKKYFTFGKTDMKVKVNKDIYSKLIQRGLQGWYDPDQ